LLAWNRLLLDDVDFAMHRVTVFYSAPALRLQFFHLSRQGVMASLRPLEWSRHAARAVAADAALAAELEPERGPWTAGAMQAFLASARAGGDDAAVGRALRELRSRVLLRTFARDLAGRASLAEVTGAMSDLAEVAIAAALERAHAHADAECRVPDGARPQSLLVVGMGKLGGRELNVSSDIDLVFVYPEEGELPGPRGLSLHEYYARVGRRVIALLDEVTPQGRVFRVDMRLRPWGDAAPVATGFEALEQYFITQGREWERYAWIKGRVVAGGPDAAIGELADLVKPFVYRKYLDFGTIAAVRALHAQIRQEGARRDYADHVKLGPGGIREVEFIAQAHQLIRGGRDRALQVRPTLDVLARLAERGLLDHDTVRELGDAYVYLRQVEHRLQYLDDAQTHRLPATDEDRARIAASMGAADWDAFRGALDTHRAAVTRHFEAVFARSGTEGAAAAPQVDALATVWLGHGDADAGRALLAARGFPEAGALYDRLQRFRAGSRYQQLPAHSRERLDSLLPRMLEAAAATPRPDATMTRALDFLEAISRRAAYLALLTEQPQALGRVVELLGSSSWAAEYLTRHPILLDELLDARLATQAPDWSAFVDALRRETHASEGDVERQMDVMRELHHAQLFRLLTQDLAGALSVERLADHLSLAADLVLAVTLEVCWKRVASRHVDTPRFAIVGYGKLGGKELGYASDLDIVFLYDDPQDNAGEVYARLAQRINTWLSSTTPAGTLFETDLRLRPNGESGLMVSSMAAFRRYQLESAWVWEHQALTRARFCAGDAAIGAVFDALRRDILTAVRDPAALAADVLTMRKRMADGHPNKSGLFDLKHDRGGMIDIEFMVQYLVLAHAARHPELTGNLGNIALLHMAGALGLVPAAAAGAVADAYRSFRRRQHQLRLEGAQYARVAPAAVAAESAATRELWQSLFASNTT
jgi:glutamate-ammonia-ligase adenylyltransferase